MFAYFLHFLRTRLKDNISNDAGNLTITLSKANGNVIIEYYPK